MRDCTRRRIEKILARTLNCRRVFASVAGVGYVQGSVDGAIAANADRPSSQILILLQKVRLMKWTSSLMVCCKIVLYLSLPCLGAVRVEQVAKLTPDDGALGDRFGFSVDIDGNLALVGAPLSDEVREDSGSAFLFDILSGNQLAELNSSDSGGGDEFGASVALDGDRMIVGAPNADAADSNRDVGAAYLFDTINHDEFAILRPDISLGSDFGSSVAVDGDIAVVVTSTSISPSVFDATTGLFLKRVTVNDPLLPFFSDFGNVAIDSGVVLIGASEADADNSREGDTAGSAYLIDVNTGSRFAKLTAEDPARFDRFGHSVALDGNLALVGAYQDDDGGSASGSAYVFDTRTGAQLVKLKADDASEGDIFGLSVATDGNLALVGAPGDAEAGPRTGSAYLFDATTGQQLAKLTADDASMGDRFGFSVALDGNRALIGAMSDDGIGSAYLFTIVPEPTTIALVVIASLTLNAAGRRHLRGS